MKVILIANRDTCFPFAYHSRVHLNYFFFIAIKSGTLLCQKEQEKEKNIPKPSKHGQM